MAAKKKVKAGKPSEGSKALEFARTYLRKKPTAAYADVRDAAKKKRLTLYPISYGRALSLEGIAKPKKAKKKSGRGPGRPKGSKNKVKRGPGRPRGPGGPRKVVTGEFDAVETLVSTIKHLQRERDQALATLDRVRRLLEA